MIKPLQFGDKAPTVKPLEIGESSIKKLPLTGDIDGGLKLNIVKADEKSFDIKQHPNLYGAYGAVKETAKELIPYVKYFDGDERDRFLKLSKQKQVRELLLENLSTVLYAGAKPLTEGGKAVFKRYFPRAFDKIAKVANVKIGKSKPAVAPEPVKVEPKVEQPPTDKMPKYAGSVNLERQNISDAAKQVELEMFEKYGTKTTVSHKETVKKAEKIIAGFKKDPEHYAERIAKIKAGQTPTIEEGVAHRILNAKDMEGFVKMAEGVEAGTTSKEALAKAQESLRDKYINVNQPYAAESGRRLSSFNIEVGKNKALEAIAKLTKPINKRQLKDLKNVDWDNPDSIKQFTKNLDDPKLREYFYEYWYNSILSGIPTHVVNTVSNTAWQLWQLPHRALTSGVDKVVSTLSGKARTRFINEMVPMFAGMKTGAKRGIGKAYEVVTKGKIQEAESKWALEIGSSLGAWERSPNAAVRGVGKFLTIPTKALRGMDVLANSIAYDSQLNALARRSANLKGMTKATRGAFEDTFRKNPPDWAHKEAMEYAKYSTFMDDPGWFSTAIIKLRNKVPGGRLVIPFVNTIGNLFKRGIEMTPGLGLTLAKGQNPSEVIAKQIEGATIGLWTLAMIADDRITGSAPTAENEREAFYRQGKKAWSIKVGDEWYQYRRIEPFNTIIASVTVAYDAIRNAKDDDTAIEIFGVMTNDLKNNLIDSGYLQGVTNILNRHGSLKGMEKRLATSLVPYSGFLQSINKSVEALKTGSAKLRDTSTWEGAFSRVIPGLNEKAKPKLDVWGNEIVLEGGMFRQWLPYRWSTEKKDITEDSLETLGVYPGRPSDTFKYKDETIKMDEDIYRDYCLVYGSKAKERLDKLFSKPNIQRSLKDENKHPIIADIIDGQITSLKQAWGVRAKREQIKRNRESLK